MASGVRAGPAVAAPSTPGKKLDEVYGVVCFKDPVQLQPMTSATRQSSWLSDCTGRKGDALQERAIKVRFLVSSFQVPLLCDHLTLPQETARQLRLTVLQFMSSADHGPLAAYKRKLAYVSKLIFNIILARAIYALGEGAGRARVMEFIVAAKPQVADYIQSSTPPTAVHPRVLTTPGYPLSQWLPSTASLRR